jgi:4-diphosphocytidyl-2-C-methyl-D-erythritol kinase
MVLAAPAKINLSLRIIGRRSDGYHLLDSVMLPLDLCDRLQVELTGRRGIRLRCPGFPGLEGYDNLAWRAADLYSRHARWPAGVKITLEKRIPLAAGLGGASSDAAAVLRALEQMNPAPLGDNLLYLLAEKLGADVPFFLKACPCRAMGVGEVLFPLRLKYRPWVLLAGAPFGLLQSAPL